MNPPLNWRNQFLQQEYLDPTRYTQVEYPLEEAFTWEPAPLPDPQRPGVQYGLDLGSQDMTVEIQLLPTNPAPLPSGFLERYLQEMERVLLMPGNLLRTNNEPLREFIVDLSDIRARGEPLQPSKLEPDPEAEARAMSLLFSNLTKEQEECYRAHGYFVVTGQCTKRIYQILNRKTMNIFVVNCVGLVVKGLCVVPKGNLPLGDVLLAQKLALELYELETLATAHVFYDMNASGRAGDDRGGIQDYWPWRLD